MAKIDSQTGVVYRNNSMEIETNCKSCTTNRQQTDRQFGRHRYRRTCEHVRTCTIHYNVYVWHYIYKYTYTYRYTPNVHI